MSLLLTYSPISICPKFSFFPLFPIPRSPYLASGGLRGRAPGPTRAHVRSTSCPSAAALVGVEDPRALHHSVLYDLHVGLDLLRVVRGNGLLEVRDLLLEVVLLILPRGGGG